MNDLPSDISSTPERQGAFSRAIHSIRTRYSLATALFLLVILGLFYVGGRVVLIHLVTDAESQVTSIGEDIRRLAYHDLASLQRTAAVTASRYAAAHATTMPLRLEDLLRPNGEPPIRVVLRLTAAGDFARGVIALPGGGSAELGTNDVALYAADFPRWVHERTTGSGIAAGIITLRGQSFYIAIEGFGAGDTPGGYLIVGTEFHAGALLGQLSGRLEGVGVKVTDRRSTAVSIVPGSAAATNAVARAHPRRANGIVPIVSEAISYYSGGFWELGSSPFEAVFPIRDIAGNAVSMISVSLPRTFASVTSVALGRLTVFIAVIGIILILPIFWLQSRILLNPLTEISCRIRAVGEHHADTDCPRLEWKGKDEFAQLAVAVNAMLETISRRSLAVAQVEARQRALIAGVPDALLVFDRNHRLVAVTKQPDGVESVPGCVVGHPLDRQVCGESAAAFEAALDRVFAHGELARVRLDFSTRPVRHFETRLSRMDDHFALAIVRDVTAETAEHDSRLAAESRLVRAQKQESLGILAAGIAHDVNNILAVVLNTAEVTWMDATDPEVVSALTTIRDAVKHGSAMARELMTVAGETKILLKRSDPSDVVREVQRLAQGIVSADVTVSYDLPPGLPAVDVDPQQIWKVFFNLIKNAAEAMDGHGGEIRVSTRKYEMTPESVNDFYSTNPIPPGPGVIFQIADNGAGIPPEVLKRVFDPFFSTKSVGRGLGLATVFAIVDAHNGGISVQSALGRGTVFRIFLPVSKLLGEVTRRLQPLTNGGSILLIDNDPAILRTTSILLQTLRVTVTTATNNHDALSAFRRLAPQLTCVLLDAHLGALDTVHLMSALRASSPLVPIVVCSGSSKEKVAEMFASRPYDGFLAKPYTLAELQDALARYSRKIEPQET